MSALTEEISLKIGSELPEFVTTITKTDIVRYAGAGGDFNPIHHDDELAKSLGLPSVFSMGLLQGGILTNVLTKWAPENSIKKYKIRFINPVWPGDTITCRGVISSIEKETGSTILTIDLYVETDTGSRVIEGESTLIFTSSEKHSGLPT